MRTIRAISFHDIEKNRPLIIVRKFERLEVLIKMGILDFLFGKKSKGSHQKIRFDLLILDSGDKIPSNKWYQKASSKNKSFVSYRGNWGSDWKYASEYPGESDVKVAGISHGDRATDFLQLAQSDNFLMSLEDEPNNPVNKNARKVLASATVEGELVTKHIGYLPDKIGNKYAGVELNISPKSVFLPTNIDLNLGLEITLLQRSARYLKKKAKENASQQ